MAFFNPPPPPLRFWSAEVLLATWGGSGLLKPAPGTWGSLAALPIAWGILSIGGHPLLLMASALIFGAGLWSAQKYMAATGQHDASPIVIDEVAGQWIALLLSPLSIAAFLTAFGLFRLFDILKPWPIKWIDKSVDGAFGVMADDVAAGIAALGTNWILWTYVLG